MNARIAAIAIAVLGVALGAMIARADDLQLTTVVVAWLGVISAIVSAAQAFLPAVHVNGGNGTEKPVRRKPPMPPHG